MRLYIMKSSALIVDWRWQGVIHSSMHVLGSKPAQGTLCITPDSAKCGTGTLPRTAPEQNG